MAIGMVNTLHLLHELQGELFYIIKLLGLCVMTKYSSRFNLGCWSMPRTLVSISGVNPEMSSRFAQCPFLKLWRISLWRLFARQGQIFPRTNGMYSLCIWAESVTSTWTLPYVTSIPGPGFAYGNHPGPKYSATLEAECLCYLFRYICCVMIIMYWVFYYICYVIFKLGLMILQEEQHQPEMWCH